MAGNTDGQVVIEVDLSSNDAEKELSRLKKKFLSLEEDLTVGRHKKDALTQNLESYKKELENVQAQTTFDGGKVIVSPENVKKIVELKDSIVRAEKEIETQNAALENTQMTLDGVKIRYNEVREAAAQAAEQAAQAAEQAAQAAAEKAAAEQASQAAAEATKEASEEAAQASEEVAQAEEQVSDSANKSASATSAIADGFRKAKDSLSHFADGYRNLQATDEEMANIESSLRRIRDFGVPPGWREMPTLSNQISSAFQRISSAIKGAFGNIVGTILHPLQAADRILGKIASTIGNIAKTASGKLVTGLKFAATHIGKMFTGSKSLSKSFGDVWSAVKRIAPALLATRGVMGILRKAVNAYMEKNQQLANTLNGVWTGLGNIMGPVIDRMVNLLANAIAYFTKFLNLLGFTGKTASKQISGAGGATKKETDKLKKQLMSFDELNILQDNESDSGSGGSGADTGVTPNVQIPDWAQLMAQQLRSAQWAEAATTLTTALNNMVDSVDWAGIGAKIGSWLNGAMTFLATAINTFDWQGLGGRLATSVNNLISSVDWRNLGTILAGKFKIIVSTLAGFILNLDMIDLAHAANNIVISFFNSITDTIVNTDWYAIGEQIKTFLVNVDWIGIATAVFGAIGAAFGAMGAVIAGLVSDAVAGIRDYFKEYIDKYIALCPDDQNLGYFIVAGILDGIANAFVNIATWIYENMFKPFMDGFKDAFGIHSPSTVMAEQGGYIIDGMLNGITGAWQRVKDWFSKALSDIRQAFSDAWTSVRNTTVNIWNGIVNAIRGAVNKVISVINRMISAVVDGINAVFRRLSFNVSLPGGKRIGLSLPQVSTPQIPYLAQGAVIPPNAPFLAMLGDQKHGTNVETPVSTIENAVATVMEDYVAAMLAVGEAVVQAIQEKNMSVVIGDRDIGEANARYSRQMAIRRG